MKKTYKIPVIEISSLLTECFLETFSRPKIGEVDDPSVGQVKQREDLNEEDELEMMMLMDDNKEQDNLW